MKMVVATRSTKPALNRRNHHKTARRETLPALLAEWGVEGGVLELCHSPATGFQVRSVLAGRGAGVTTRTLKAREAVKYFLENHYGSFCTYDLSPLVAVV